MVEPWYAAGLRFDCGRCGNCCSGPDGVVRYTPDELKTMADHLGILPFEFVDRYTREDEDGRRTLTEVPGSNGRDCVFLERDSSDRALCSIHVVRPQQCRTWPFWPENLTAPGRWDEIAKGCAGVAAGIEGRGTSFDITEIERQRDATPGM